MALVRSPHSNTGMSAIRISLPLPRVGIAPAQCTAALAAGVLAGTAALALMQWLSTVAYDESPWKLPRMMGALVHGPAALGDEYATAPVALGFAVHYALSLLYAAALAAVLATLRREHAPAAGLAFGIVLYTVNLHGFTALFPWFAEMRTADTLVAHGVFGLVAACAWCELSRPRDEEDID
jgi:hypothetical protein